ncbi:hypothetical protein [Corynebacterium sp. AOP12-C2-36]|uniref:hypothetical protein n=1 Tax=Corynebacterium sp. AOP12-C2-36 TaxID=3457723 RepID=UPI004034A151
MADFDLTPGRVYNIREQVAADGSSSGVAVMDGDEQVATLPTGAFGGEIHDDGEAGVGTVLTDSGGEWTAYKTEGGEATDILDTVDVSGAATYEPPAAGSESPEDVEVTTSSDSAGATSDAADGERVEVDGYAADEAADAGADDDTGVTPGDDELSDKVSATIEDGGTAVYNADRGGWVLRDSGGQETELVEAAAPPYTETPTSSSTEGDTETSSATTGKPTGEEEPQNLAPTRSASIGEDADNDGWVDDKERLEPGSLDLPNLVSGRDVEKALENYSPDAPGTGLKAAGDGRFLPTIAGDGDANTQISGYEDAYLGSHNDALINAPEGSFLNGLLLHNLSGTETAVKDLSETMSTLEEGARSIYAKGVGDPTMDARMAEISDTLTGLTEIADAVTAMGQGAARAGDGYNSITKSMAQATQDAYQQIYTYADAHDGWEQSGIGSEPRPEFDFITDELDAAVGEVGTALESTVQTEVGAASEVLLAGTDASYSDGSRNEGGSTPASSGSSAGGPLGSAAGGGYVGSSGGLIRPATSDSSSSGSSGPNRDAAEKLADLLTSGNGAQAGGQPIQQGAQMPTIGQMPQMPGMDQLGQQQMGADPSAYQTMPTDSVGMTVTDDPYESLLNPATHLTRGFEAGDMSQIREGAATGRDAATIRPYTAEARSADGLLTSPPASGPGAAAPRPTALGADMKPLDKDGDGKVDDDAVPATAENVLDGNGEPKEVPTAVMIDGEPHKVTMDDPRLLEMMNIVGAEGEDGSSIEILDAAAEAGIELESYGEMLEDPTEAKAGDVVISSKGSGFYLGDGSVLLESGEVVPLGDVLELRPPQSGIFRLELPELPDEVDTGDGEDAADGGEGDGADADADEAAADEVAVEPTDGGTEPPATEDPEPAAGEPVEAAEGGAAPGEPEPEPEPEPEAPVYDGAGEMPQPSIAAEFEDLDGDGIPDDNNANGIPDVEEPLPGTETEEAAPVEPEPEAPAPVEGAAEAATEDEPDDAAEDDVAEPIFEGSASLRANIDGEGAHASGEAEATIRDVPFEGRALG